MNTYQIPDDLLNSNVEKVNFIYYKNQRLTQRVRVMFTQNLVSFIIEGKKEIFHSDTPIVLQNKIAIIKKTNYLMTETKIASDNTYKALLVFFDDEIITNFQVKYQHIVNKIKEINHNSISVIENDTILTEYRNNLVTVLKTKREILSKEYKQIKFEELFLYLLQTYPQKIMPILNQSKDKKEANFKSIVENNSIACLTLEELSFLCNMSISTFKRHFFKHYKLSPQKWFLIKRMEYAERLLQKGKKPTEIYAQIGYSTLSNFLKAYKEYSATK